MVTMYYVIKHDRPLSDCSWLLDLQRQNGAYQDCDVLGDRYTKWKFGKQSLKSLATTVRVLTVQPEMDESMFVGFITDEGSVHRRSQLISFYRLCVQGRSKVRFSGIDRLLNGKARTKTLVVLHRFRKDRVELKQVGCFGSDGDATFSGCRTGVAARLMRLQLLLLAFHCVLHQIPLGSKDATALPAYTLFQSLGTTWTVL